MEQNNTINITYKYDSDTKGTYKYVALDKDGKSVIESKAKLDIGSNIIYVQKSSVNNKKKPDTISATFTFNY